MSTMSNYCKAYPAARLREYPSWREKMGPLVAPPSEEESSPEESSPATADGSTNDAREEYYYLHDNFVVTASVFVDEHVAFDDVTEDWKAFCQERLEFQIPPEALEDERGGASV